jgi:hypothetical protein
LINKPPESKFLASAEADRIIDLQFGGSDTKGKMNLQPSQK